MRESRVLDLLAAAIESREPPAECLQWLRRGLRAYVFEGLPLEQALQLTAVHPKGCRYAYQYRRMRNYLRQAAETLPGNAWTRAKVLSAAMREFSRRPQRSAETPLDQALHRAWEACGGKWPSSPERLYELIGGDDFVCNGFKQSGAGSTLDP